LHGGISMNRLRIAFIIGILGTITICPQFQWAKNGLGKELGKYLAGDFHQHTLYTDGSTTFDFVMAKNNEFGLDWWANSEHGGSRNRDGNGNFWDEYATNPIVGKVASSGGHQVMWRWQSLRDFVFPDILRNRSIYSQKMILSGLEWNVPGHEHCSTGIAGNDASAIAEFEYRFDGSDSDDIGGESQGWSDKNYTNNHSKAIEAVTWMQLHHENDGYIVFAHVERKGQGDPNYVGTGSRGYNISDFRDFNNAAPNVCIGFEGAPGHQVNSDRGFGNSVSCIDETCTSQDFGGTYGGVGFYSAKVGGLWDALLGEGRRWFNFASSDYHTHWTAGGDDFYPGEYQKTYVYTVDEDGDGQYSPDEIVHGMHSGNSFFVLGDLVNHLEFEAQNNDQLASMGGELMAKGGVKNLKIKIKFKSPSMNNHGNRPTVDHIDLIAGEISGKVDPESDEYNIAENPATQVLATFSRGDWDVDKEGFHTIVFHLKDVSKNMYFRLRGTNLPPNTPFETDAAGNPLPDALVTQNTGVDGADEAWQDLWFYSNPIFVYVK
jgi:hypothetical protein